VAQKKEGSQEYVFDDYTRAAAQLTPIKHEYDLEDVLKEDGSRGFKIIPPEFRRQGKDIRSVMTNWRRNLDIRSMDQVERAILSGEGEELGWSSPKSEKWEGELINKYNSDYGYHYKAQIMGKNGLRKLIVLDYRLPFQVKAFDHYIKSSSNSVFNEDESENLPLIDQVMSTVGVKNEVRSEEQTWRELIESDKASGGDGRVWGLEEDNVLKVQNRRLHDVFKDRAAARVAQWLIGMIEDGVSPDVVQRQVKTKYILETQESVQYYNGLLQQEKPLANLNNKPHGDEFDPRVLGGFSGFGGIGCGDWGGSSAFQAFTSFGLSNPGATGKFALSIESKKCIKCHSAEAERGGCGFCTSCASSFRN
jgi:hypothetical protein